MLVDFCHYVRFTMAEPAEEAPQPSEASVALSISQSILAVLTFDLPDPEEELFVQHNNDLTTFTCFQRLAIELRLQIWRETFPNARHLPLYETNYDHFDTFRPEFGKANIAKMKIIQNNLLISLSVNKETRAEALISFAVVPVRAYDQVGKSHHNGFAHVRMPFCIQLKIDSLGFYYNIDSDAFYNKWLDHVRIQARIFCKMLRR
ncbi:hypothetical protein LSUE1_G010014 [Lachnellula suecica]|uniref:2EXR domain-containing protein n=1 Tax=Lachnellula suecica TaxID=602035 RepID=A0A8T9BVP7_9HELO|nr:hypothetical protein LSUE1_G010014 [Lachnellula suecica]